MSGSCHAATALCSCAAAQCARGRARWLYATVRRAGQRWHGPTPQPRALPRPLCPQLLEGGLLVDLVRL